MLIDAGADVNMKELIHGRTSLMLSACSGHTRCIENLVTQGKADIHLTDNDGNDAAYYATHYGHGLNKIIAKKLGIQNSNSNPRAITKYATKPKITVSNDETDELLKEIAAYGEASTLPNFTPQKQSTGLSLGISDTCWSYGSTPSKPTDTPFHTPFTSSATPHKRKRRLLATYSSGYSNSSDSSRSPYSPHGQTPLPNNLEDLLQRIGMIEYFPLLNDNGIDLYVFLILSDHDLQELGVNRLGHRRRMLASQLRFRESVEISSAQEHFLADWLLLERHRLLGELKVLKLRNEQLGLMVLQLEDNQSPSKSLSKSPSN